MLNSLGSKLYEFMYFSSQAIVTWRRIDWPFSGFYLWGLRRGRGCGFLIPLKAPVGNDTDSGYEEREPAATALP